VASVIRNPSLREYRGVVQHGEQKTYQYINRIRYARLG
jgi:hypothetical protein